MRFCSEEETLFHFGYNKDKWEFVTMEQGRGHWIDN
jgi:hypothetical protein